MTEDNPHAESDRPPWWEYNPNWKPPAATQDADLVRLGRPRFVWADGAFWWRIYRVGGYDGYRTLTRRLPCGELARRIEK